MTAPTAKLARSAAMASITVAVILVALKTWASWRTGSTAMLGSLADSALDLIASLATLQATGLVFIFGTGQGQAFFTAGPPTNVPLLTGGSNFVGCRRRWATTCTGPAIPTIIRRIQVRSATLIN